MIKVMSYNVCWEALDAAKTKIDMTKCIANNKNKCMLNICNIINTRLLDNYDFICLQETWYTKQDLGNLNNLHNSFHGTGSATVDLRDNLCADS